MINFGFRPISPDWAKICIPRRLFQHEYAAVHSTRRSKNETDRILFVIQLALINYQIFCEYRKIADWFKIIFPDKLDDAFEGMVDDEDAFLDGWFAVRKIKGRHKPKDKGPKDPGENN